MSKSEKVSKFLDSIAESAEQRAAAPESFIAALFETQAERERRLFNARTAEVARHFSQLFA